MRSWLVNMAIGRRLGVAFGALGRILRAIAGIGLSSASSERTSTIRVSDTAQMVSTALEIKFQAAAGDLTTLVGQFRH